MRDLLGKIKYHLNVFYHYPIDIRIGKMHFYAYKISFFDKENWEFKNYSNDDFFGDNRKIRWVLNFFGYSFDFNIYE